MGENRLNNKGNSHISPIVVPDLAGKLHFLMGDMDDYYLTNGLRILEETLNVMEAPAAGARFTWLPYHGHCGFGTQAHYIDVLEDITRRAADSQ